MRCGGSRLVKEQRLKFDFLFPRCHFDPKGEIFFQSRIYCFEEDPSFSGMTG